ncbi:hypothetical protein N9Y60_03550 [Crocinitomicaceae bacterium]|jgi:hypothetical protein|nr:hypothetical protein [Crocinitomicaceae bacterium]
MSDKTVFNELYKERFGRTICEVHREMYDIMYNNLRLNPHYEELTTKLDEAYQMAKKMDAKLRQYKNNYDDGWWEKERKEVIKEKLKKRNNR